MYVICVYSLHNAKCSLPFTNELDLHVLLANVATSFEFLSVMNVCACVMVDVCVHVCLCV